MQPKRSTESEVLREPGASKGAGPFLQEESDRDAPSLVCAFLPGQVLLHVKTARCYEVLLAPDVCRLEADRGPAYAYRLHGEPGVGDPTVWVRCAREMEDGRFQPVAD